MNSHNEQQCIDELEKIYLSLLEAIRSLQVIYRKEYSLTNSGSQSLSQVLSRGALATSKAKKSALNAKIQKELTSYYNHLDLQIAFLEKICEYSGILEQELNQQQKEFLKQKYALSNVLTYGDIIESGGYCENHLSDLLKQKENKTSKENMLSGLLEVLISKEKLDREMSRKPIDLSKLLDALGGVQIAIQNERKARNAYIPQNSEASWFQYRKPLIIAGGIFVVGGLIAAGIFTGGLAWLGAGIAGGIGMGALSTGAVTGVGLVTAVSSLPAVYFAKKMIETVMSATRKLLLTPFYLLKNSKRQSGDNILIHLNNIHDYLNKKTINLANIQYELGRIENCLDENNKESWSKAWSMFYLAYTNNTHLDVALFKQHLVGIRQEFENNNKFKNNINAPGESSTTSQSIGNESQPIIKQEQQASPTEKRVAEKTDTAFIQNRLEIDPAKSFSDLAPVSGSLEQSLKSERFQQKNLGIVPVGTLPQINKESDEDEELNYTPSNYSL